MDAGWAGRLREFPGNIFHSWIRSKGCNKIVSEQLSYLCSSVADHDAAMEVECGGQV